MGKSNEISNDVQATINTTWKKRTGYKIPNTEDIALVGGAVEIEATFLYADLADSSRMAKELDRRVTAKILKSFLATTSKLIKHNGGRIVSFDGDRVMGVFYGGSKNSNAAKCALQINYAVCRIIRPKFEENYQSVKDASFNITHGVGVDTGSVLAVRCGVRGSNDIIWIERAPNLAAKLSNLREDSCKTFITSRVYKMLHDSSKYGGDTNANMWQEKRWKFLEEVMNIYCSNWVWEP